MSSDEMGVGGLRSSNRQRQRRVRGCLVALVALAVLVGAGAFVYVKAVDLLSDRLHGPADYTGDGSGSVVVQVHDGDTATDIGETLHRKKVVASTEAFSDAAMADPRATSIQVGFYQLNKRMSAKSALNMLLDPDSRVQSTVTIPEGYTVDQTVKTLAKETDFPVKAYVKALRKPDKIGLPAYAHGNPEGFLYPATYEIPPNADAADVLSMMVDRWKQEAESLDLQAKAKKLGLTPYQALILASIAQAEMRESRYFPMVSRALLNRVDQGQAFQLDTTGHWGYTKGLAKSTIVSPRVKKLIPQYDTYKHVGWPPGPINSPGSDALEGAVNPADGPWLFWVTTNLETGETHFSRTYGEHSKWVAQYRQYCESSKYC